MCNTITVRIDLERIVLMVRWNCVVRYVIWSCFVVLTRGQLQSSWQRQLATVLSASRRWPSEESSKNTEAVKYRSSQVPSEDDATNRYAQQWRVHPCMTLCVCIATCTCSSVSIASTPGMYKPLSSYLQIVCVIQHPSTMLSGPQRTMF